MPQRYENFPRFPNKAAEMLVICPHGFILGKILLICTIEVHFLLFCALLQCNLKTTSKQAMATPSPLAIWIDLLNGPVDF